MDSKFTFSEPLNSKMNYFEVIYTKNDIGKSISCRARNSFFNYLGIGP